MKKKILSILLVTLFLVSIIATGCSQNQESEAEVSEEESSVSYPERTINAIVGFSPGGPTDVIARGILPILQEELGVGIGISNMPGAASAKAASYVLDQPADGYTLLFGSEAMSIWQVMDIMDLSPTKDFIPIKLVSQAIPVLAVPPDSEFDSAKEFIDYAKEHPSELRIGTAGPGTVPHISGLILEKQLGCKFTFVPFQGGRPAITAVMGGQVDATIEMVQGMVEAYKGGKLKILASFTNEPVEGLDVPALGEEVPELQAYLPYGPYFGLFAPKGTPEDIVKILEEKMDKAIQDQRWNDYCKKMYLVQMDLSGDEAMEFLEEWTSKAAWLLYETGGAKRSPEEFGIEKQ